MHLIRVICFLFLALLIVGAAGLALVVGRQQPPPESTPTLSGVRPVGLDTPELYQVILCTQTATSTVTRLPPSPFQQKIKMLSTLEKRP